jgi:cytochrome bd-type quinol oxidase subunit 2
LKNLSWDQIYDEYGNRFESKDEFDQAVDNYYSFWFKFTLLILMIVQIALALKLATIKEIGKTVFYVLNFTFFVFGVVFMITGGYAWYFREQYYLQDIYPMSFIYVLFVIGILITFLAFIGYLTFAWKLKKTIKAYIVLTFVLSATFLGYYIYFEAKNMDVIGYIKNQCVGILTIIPEDKF